jgi:hypothetical protein
MEHDMLIRKTSSAPKELIVLLLMGQGGFKLKETSAVLQAEMTRAYVKKLGG